MASNIAILGWGSLLWDKHEDFDSLHGEWRNEGPILKLEFSRVSTSRNGALTLVIDPDNGAPVTVAYCLSSRTTIANVIADLQRREGSPTSEHIGYIDYASGREHFGSQVTGENIRAWVAEHNFSGVVWTDFSSNFVERLGVSFSTDAAITYLNNLDSIAKVSALEYIAKAPDFIKTPLRTTLGAQLTR